MSGGHFNYDQYRIENIIDSIVGIIDDNKKPIREEDRDPWDDSEFYHNYPDDIIEEFKKGVEYLRIAKIYAQRIDWLISGDDGEDSFRKRLKEDLEQLNK